MSRTWYGSLSNRLEENRQFVDEIKVGDGVTEYFYSDCHPYEVVEVESQKRIKIRELDHKLIGEAFSNDWELISNEENPVCTLVKRGKYWYTEKIATVDDLTDDFETRYWLAMNGFDSEVIKAKGFQKKYSRRNISIGKAEYYYDYSF